MGRYMFSIETEGSLEAETRDAAGVMLWKIMHLMWNY